MRFHTQTAGVSLTAQQPEVNIVRTAIEALAGVLGGTQSLHTNSMDETLALPSEKAARIALRTQQVIAHETRVTNVADPLGGSWYVEALTDEMEQRAEDLFATIGTLGDGSMLDGAVRGVEEGWYQAEIADSAYELERKLNSGRHVVVGVNGFLEGSDEPPPPILRIGPEVEEEQRRRLDKVKRERNAAAVESALARVRAEAAVADVNLMPALHRRGERVRNARRDRRRARRCVRPVGRGRPHLTVRPRLRALMDDRLLEIARSAKGFMPDDEGLALLRRGRAPRARSGPLLEVGTYCGKSAVYLGAAARAPGTVLFTVDHHRGSEENQAGWEHHDREVVDPETGRMDTLPFFRRTMYAAGLEDVVVGVVGHSVPVARAWQTPLGFLFIDGGHAEDVAMADYENWSLHVVRGDARDPRRVRRSGRRRPGAVPRLATRGRRRLRAGVDDRFVTRAARVLRNATSNPPSPLPVPVPVDPALAGRVGANASPSCSNVSTWRMFVASKSSGSTTPSRWRRNR